MSNLHQKEGLDGPIEGTIRKQKIFQKAVHICLQQIDRVVQLYNKILQCGKLKSFKLSLEKEGNPEIKEELAKRVLIC